MYRLTTPLPAVKGIGPQLNALLQANGYSTVLDLLLAVPLRYEDRSQFSTITSAPANQLLTISASLLKISTSYRGRRTVTTAKISDKTGTMTVLWFNNRFAQSSLQVGQEYLFSGKVNDRRTMVQPLFEKLKVDTIHTGRLIPLYSSTLRLKQGTLRRLLKEITTHLESHPDPIQHLLPKKYHMPDLQEALCQLHFPETEPAVVAARERLALEELLGLIRHSHQLKAAWQKKRGAHQIHSQQPLIPNTIPFALTQAQQRCINEIKMDLNRTSPMNRILIGDVGSGKTVVAGIAARQVILSGHNVGLIAPTQILAEQHAATLSELFPDLEIELITAVQSKRKNIINKGQSLKFYVGTHALINQLLQINPAFIIYDEQHRFGVKQRSAAENLPTPPHVLTMTATPIPRTMLLTIFSHLNVSVIDELPNNRLPTKTWVLPETKRIDMYAWIYEQISKKGAGQFQSLVVCPFINPSENEGLADVAATTQKYQTVKAAFKKLEKQKAVDLITQKKRAKEEKQTTPAVVKDKQPIVKIAELHGKMKKTAQQQVIEKMFQQKIDILVTTPIVEVGIDLPQAAAMIIESAERFGLASLHQLRGRVGRAGQQGYCLVFSNTKSSQAKRRLRQFSQTNNGQELAEIDLQHRGAGDLFGVEQHGWGTLQFASWTNFELISIAQHVFKKLPSDWQPLFSFITNDKQLLAN